MPSSARSAPTPAIRRELEFEYFCSSALTPDPTNARKHPKKQIVRLAAEIREFGFTNPILVDENAQVIAGHARLEAATLAMSALGAGRRRLEGPAPKSSCLSPTRREGRLCA